MATTIPGGSYIVDGQTVNANGEPIEWAGDGPTTTSVADMTLAELQDYAAAREIDLGDATKKADVRAAIEAATEAD